MQPPRDPFPSASLASSAGDRPLAPGLRLGEYEIEQVYSESSDSVLYLAYDHGLQRRVALREYLPLGLAGRGPAGEVRLLSPEHAERFSQGLSAFAQEARLLARCDHPALVKVLRYWEARQTGYMAMPWYEGETLQLSRNSMPHPPGEAWLRTLLVHLLGALDVLHAAFAQHRHIIPRNILIQPDGQPVLLGFHASRRVLDEHGQILRDPEVAAYLPIEAQPEGVHLQQGVWSDLYSLAALSYFCLTGTPPPSAAERITNGSPRPLSTAVRALCAQHPGLQYSTSFVSALDWAFELQPQHRPRSAAEWRVVLEQTALPAGTTLKVDRPAGAAPPATAASAEPQRRAPVREQGRSGEEVLTDIPLRAASFLPPNFSSPRHAASPASAPARQPVETPVEPGFTQPATRREAPAGPLKSHVPPAPVHAPASSPAAGAAPQSDPTEEQIRASVAAALESVSPTPADAPAGIRAPRKGAAATTEPLPRRWGWVATAALVLMAGAAGWQWMQQRHHDSLSRTMASGTVSAPSALPALPQPPREAALPTETDATGKVQESSPVAPELPASSPAAAPSTSQAALQPLEIPSSTPPAPAGAVEPALSTTTTGDVKGPSASAIAAASDQAAPEAEPAATLKAAPPAGDGSRENASDRKSRPVETVQAEKGERPSRAKERVAQSGGAPSAAPAKVQFTSPRAACAPRERFSLYYCMQQQCKRSQFYQHRQCKVLRERDEIE